MAMELARIRTVCSYYERVLSERLVLIDSIGDVHDERVQQRDKVVHLHNMIPRLFDLIDTETRREKAMRWYGFIQCGLWMLDIFTVDQIKAHSNPDEEPPT